MKRRIVCIILTLTLALSLIPAFSQEVSANPSIVEFGNIGTGNQIRWELFSDGELRLTRVGATYPSIAIPDYGTGGGPWSARGPGIERIRIGSGINRIGNNAFRGLVNLQTVRAYATHTPAPAGPVGNYITSIGSHAFFGSSRLQHVDIRPAGASSPMFIIGDSAFGGTRELLSFNSGVDGLINLNAAQRVNPAAVSNCIGANAFREAFVLPAGSGMAANRIIEMNNTLAIGANAFASNNAVIEAHMGRLRQMGDDVFRDNVNLREITLHNTMTHNFGERVFWGTRNLNTFNVVNLDVPANAPPAPAAFRIGTYPPGAATGNVILIQGHIASATNRPARILRAGTDWTTTFTDPATEEADPFVLPTLVSLGSPAIDAGFFINRIDSEAFAFSGYTAAADTNNPPAFIPGLRDVVVSPLITTIGFNAFSWNPSLVSARFLSTNQPGRFGGTGPAPNAMFTGAAPGFTIYVPRSGNWPSAPVGTIWNNYRTVILNEGIFVSPQQTTIQVGAPRFQMSATVLPAATPVRWAVLSQTPDVPGTVVATITADGFVYAHNPGVIQVFAFAVGEASAPPAPAAIATITVIPRNLIPVQNVNLSPSVMTLFARPNLPPAYWDSPQDGPQISPPGGGVVSNVAVATVFPFDATDPAIVWSIHTGATFVAIENVYEPLYIDGVPQLDGDGQPVMVPIQNRQRIIGLRPGTAVVRATAPNGVFGQVTVTVLPSPDDFHIVTNITGVPSSVAMGSSTNLNDLITVWRGAGNADENAVVAWSVVSPPSPSGVLVNAVGQLSVPWNASGTIRVRASVANGLTPSEPWPPRSDAVPGVPFVQYFNISISAFIPVAAIIDYPVTAIATIPQPLTATVLPAAATNRAPIIWEIVTVSAAGDIVVAEADPTTGAFIDAQNRLVAQSTGTVHIRASILNAEIGFPGGATVPQLRTFYHIFGITVFPYDPQVLTLRANPGGTVSKAPGGVPTALPTGPGITAGGSAWIVSSNQTITITATPNPGFAFAGWDSSPAMTLDGVGIPQGIFGDVFGATTTFTMPANSTAVTASFTYIGVPMTFPALTHNFPAGNFFIRGSVAPLAHVSHRSADLFSRLYVGGTMLTEGREFEVGATAAGHTEIRLNIDFLGSLSAGAHSMVIHFSDHVVITASFNVSAPPAVNLRFNDVHPGAWYFAAASYAADRGWMFATGANLFRPNDQLTQGDVVDTLYAMAGRPSVLGAGGVALSGRAAAYEWVLNNGILPIGGRYQLNAAVTRQDVIHLLNRLVQTYNISYTYIRPAPVFTDVGNLNRDVRDAIISFFRAGIVNGVTAHTFAPHSSMTRAQFAALLTQFSNAT